MEFPLHQEEAGGTQEFLYRLRNSKLEDEALIDEFYNKIIDNFEYGENYYIILIHAVYDVPGKASDGSEMFDASDNVYEYYGVVSLQLNCQKPDLVMMSIRTLSSAAMRTR